MNTHVKAAYQHAQAVAEQIKVLESTGVIFEQMQAATAARRALGALVLELAEFATEERAAEVAQLPANVTRHPAWMGTGQ